MRSDEKEEGRRRVDGVEGARCQQIPANSALVERLGWNLFFARRSWRVRGPLLPLLLPCGSGWRAVWLVLVCFLSFFLLFLFIRLPERAFPVIRIFLPPPLLTLSLPACLSRT